VEKKKILFIGNPFSGAKAGTSLAELVHKYIDKDIFDYTVKMTEYATHASYLAKEAVTEGFFAVVAAGGDGTINEVAQSIQGTQTALGIIPFGSGNGFAYHLGVRRDVVKAIQLINQCHTEAIDTGMANDHFFINVAGLGLDATVAYKTKLNSRRGFFPYFIQTLKESLGFQFMTLKITTPTESWTGEYAMAVVANGSVYGYDFTVAPEAILNDGLFDVLLVKKDAIWKYFLLAPRMLTKTFHKSKLVHFLKTNSLTIQHENNKYFQVDGEGMLAESTIHLKLIPKNLLILSQP
jgi:diacylglycerol kinase (ATP)